MVPDALLTLAEVAVALAGFSSVVVLFRRGGVQSEWRPEDRFRFRVMLEASLLAAFFALLPLAISGLGVRGPLLWRVSSGLLAASLLVGLTQMMLARTEGATRALNPALGSSIAAAHGLTLLVQVSNVVGAPPFPLGPGPYVFGVVWLTVYSGLMFYRLMMAPIREG